MLAIVTDDDNKYKDVFNKEDEIKSLTKKKQKEEYSKLDEEYLEKYGISFEKYLKEANYQVALNIGKSKRGMYKTGEISGATEVLFVERCLDLLKAGGRMGIVLPEGVLNSSNLQKAREYFESRAKILLIVSLPQDLFVSSGATVKTSLVFLKKFTAEEQEQYYDVKSEAEKEAEARHIARVSHLMIAESDEEDRKKQISKIKRDLKKKNTFNESLLRQDLEILLKAQDYYKENKKKYNKEIKASEQKEQKETNELIKQKLDYEIPIAEIEKAGVSTTGAEIDNQLPELLKEFKEYIKENKLW